MTERNGVHGYTDSVSNEWIPYPEQPMTTSEHADKAWDVTRNRKDIQREPNGSILPRAAFDAGFVAALAPTPSPAQPTEQGMGLQRGDGKWVVSGGTATDGFDTPVHRIAAGPWRPITESLAPSPVQGADDRLAQAEAVIEQAAFALSMGNVSRGRDLLATYQQSPQTALNEVRAGAWDEAADEWSKSEVVSHWDGYAENFLRARAAELRAAPLRGDNA